MEESFYWTVIVVVQLLSRVWLWDPVHCSMPGFPVLYCLLEFAQTHVRWVSDAINQFILCCPFSFCLRSFPACESFRVSQLFTSGGQSTGASASASVLPVNIQDWFPLGLTDLISLQFKGFSSIFSNTTVQKHQFFGAQLSLKFNSHIHTWLLEKL